MQFDLHLHKFSLLLKISFIAQLLFLNFILGYGSAIYKELDYFWSCSSDFLGASEQW
jgi:hypothetical protein